MKQKENIKIENSSWIDEEIETPVRMTRRNLALVEGYLEWLNDGPSTLSGRKHLDTSLSDYLSHAVWSALIEDYEEYAELSGLTVEETMETVINNFVEELVGE